MLNQEQLEKLAEVMIFALYNTARKPNGKIYKQVNAVRIYCDFEALSLAEIIRDKLSKRKLNVVLEISPASIFGRVFCNILTPSKINYGRGSLFGWALCSLPTQISADRAKMSLEEYAKEVVKSCYLNDADPVSTWQKIFEESKAIRMWLLSLNIRTLHVESAGIDLKILLGAKRRWLGSDGHNIPCFENFTLPDFRGTQGTYFANMPLFYKDNYVKGVRLFFKNGKAVKVTAEEGEEFTKTQIGMDEGACRVGEFSLTDKRHSPITKFMADTLFDENVGGENGNCHIALGNSYRETYSGDLKEMSSKLEKKLGYNDSALHWDLINTEPKRATAILRGGGRQVIYENGMFKY